MYQRTKPISSLIPVLQKTKFQTKLFSSSSSSSSSSIAGKKIEPLYEKTPLIQKPTSSIFKSVNLKLDNLQPTNSFKIRGISNLVQKSYSSSSDSRTIYVASSGGNAGLAVAYSAREMSSECTIFVPTSTPSYMCDLLREQGATVNVIGSVWDEANAAALEFIDMIKAENTETNVVYCPPFEHEDIWEGHATVIDEIRQDLNDSLPDVVVVSVGGGGYFNGVYQGLLGTQTKVLAMETIGANALQASLEANEHITLPKITSIAKSLGALRVSPTTYKYAQSEQVLSQTVSDEEATEACRLFQEQFGYLVEPACGASLAVVYLEDVAKRIFKDENERKNLNVCVLVCGGNMTQ